MATQRVRIQIDLHQIVANYKHICSLVGDQTNVLAVVKADAYGHGAVPVCQALAGAGCTYFAVACIEEARALRQNHVPGTILILGNTDAAYAPQLREMDLVQTVDNPDYASALSQNGGARIHIKIDTGMSRLGLYCHALQDIPDAITSIQQIVSLPNLKQEGIFTHFADSDGETEAVTLQQYDVFRALLDELEARQIPIGIRHCCNSAAILRFPQAHLDMVRAGLILYGLMPSPYVQDPAFRPAMRMIARVAAVNTLKKGDAVSYGGTFLAPRDMRAAVLSIGYADGLPRALSDNLTVTINGCQVPLIGRICMDLCMADLGDTPCQTGDEAILFDSAEKIEEIARKLNTINYEVICLPKKRVALEYPTFTAETKIDFGQA